MIVEGLAITVAAGILGGSVLAPIKLMRSWTFEKSWAVYSVWAYLGFPWLLALFTVPHAGWDGEWRSLFSESP
jgi:hypothetical protein